MEKSSKGSMELEPEFYLKEDYESSLLSSPCFSESDTWGSAPESPNSGTLNLEQELDQVLAKHMQQRSTSPETLSDLKPSKKKRGRKPIRPNDPIRKKTEERDKYWLRAFRAYMKKNFSKVKKNLNTEERNFWIEHLRPEGKPDKGNKFLSYGKRYKNYLFSHPWFVEKFRRWFGEFGEKELKKKCKPGTELWFVFYDYACKELVNFVPEDSGSGPDSPLSCASPPDEQEPVEFSMVGIDNESFIESFLTNL